jgi:hypothetical protein
MTVRLMGSSRTVESVDPRAAATLDGRPPRRATGDTGGGGGGDRHAGRRPARVCGLCIVEGGAIPCIDNVIWTAE